MPPLPSLTCVPFSHSSQLSNIDLNDQVEGDDRAFEVWHEREDSVRKYLLQARTVIIKSSWVKEICGIQQRLALPVWRECPFTFPIPQLWPHPGQQVPGPPAGLQGGACPSAQNCMSGALSKMQCGPQASIPTGKAVRDRLKPLNTVPYRPCCSPVCTQPAHKHNALEHSHPQAGYLPGCQNTQVPMCPQGPQISKKSWLTALLNWGRRSNWLAG